uniref:NADH-ubiquinone oxidoreductase chain 4 n=1 Tax=Panaorus albomaculatus TaxID=300813 RepID=A0A1C9J9W8_9HEMI|nr:NADH dehydrogenase subunit 4 [Panaorus albomaculatus]AOP18555.1 NADH dehydrogenase subunit 4 [Panaorus albomaculatus]
MMKYIMFLGFMILFFDWWITCFMLMLFIFLFLFNNVNIYYSCLSYGFGFDMISYWMIVLTVWIISLMIFSSYLIYCSGFYMPLMVVFYFLLMFLVLSFCCSNLFYFYLFFESSMVPTIILIFGWGYQPERLSAGMYLIFYTLFASFPMLLCIFYINMKSFTLFYYLIVLDINIYIYLSMILSFLFSMPMFFVHFWLPSAHVEAPVSGSMILAGVLLKLGGYGLYRVFLFLYSYIYYNYIWIVISLYGSVVIGLLCLCQVDIKSLIAYSSVSHMGLVIGGLMTCNSLGLWGSLIMMLGHGLCSSGLFALSNIVYERTHSRSIMINSGFLLIMPSMGLMWFLLSISNMSSPPSLNLLGEIFLINSLMSWNLFSIYFLGLSSFFSCCYSIYLYSVVQHGYMYSGLNYMSNSKVREYMLIIYHWLPLNILFLKSEIFTLWL